MNKYVIKQVVECDTQQDAVIVAARRLLHNEDYGFPYRFGNQTISPLFPANIDVSIVDKIIKKVIAGVAIYYVSKSLKSWAKE